MVWRHKVCVVRGDMQPIRFVAPLIRNAAWGAHVKSLQC